jgi:glycyl-tRNA synthetase beta chain
MSLEGTTAGMQQAVQAFTRVGNLAKNAVSDVIDPTLFATDAEKALHEAYLAASRDIEAMKAARNYASVLKVMASLTGPIDAFFGQVMVMVEDVAVRNNRLALLKAITGLAAGIADLSKIVA